MMINNPDIAVASCLHIHIKISALFAMLPSVLELCLVTVGFL